MKNILLQSGSEQSTISVIIVNWNSKDYLRQCLRSLYQHCKRTDIEIIVVDGASFDGCGEMLAREFASVVFIQSETNVGFAKANNLGARSARGEYLLLLNPDTEFIEDSISIMVKHMSALPNAAAVGCRLLNADRSIQTTSILSFPTAFNRSFDSEFLRRWFPGLWGIKPLLSVGIKPTEVEAVSGACILARRKSFEHVGGFTESYFMYCEDVDLCYKFFHARLKVFHIPETSIVHYGGGSSSQTVSNFSAIMMRESWYQFIRANHGVMAASSYRICIVTTAFFRLLLIGPLLIFGTGIVHHGAVSWRKWFAILRWSLGAKQASKGTH